MKYIVEETGFTKYLQRYQSRKMVLLLMMIGVMTFAFFVLNEPAKRPPVWLIPVIVVPILITTALTIRSTNKTLRNFIGTEYMVTDEKLVVKKDFQTIKEIDIAAIIGMRIRPEGLYIVTGKEGQRFNAYRIKRSLRHLTWENTTLIPTHTSGFADLFLQLRKNRKKQEKQ